MEKVLLHCCCAPCSAAIIEWMMMHDMRPTLFYFNPNIFPEEEYLKRKNECTRYAESLGLEIIDGDYDHAEWLQRIKGLENEPERGNRCRRCFEIRLQATALLAAQSGFPVFTTTLASSRWKNLVHIFEAGNRAASTVENVTFWDKNWRKEGLTERRNILLQENNFYNQQYCGCEFSIRK
ncbi:epoxyqueuosine reductase QueH [Proteiniphilum sp. UBA5384]|uniref:epoxyqueuosine reductase QueH n=1 Tax=Proteiniphilum sp. UBA5384 TaxID=1947279 RepID=UPI0025EEE5D0|nr:epoxyqueuosine reductase QueH [Proteiniphilum sp. UBA5384]